MNLIFLKLCENAADIQYATTSRETLYQDFYSWVNKPEYLKLNKNQFINKLNLEVYTYFDKSGKLVDIPENEDNLELFAILTLRNKK